MDKIKGEAMVAQKDNSKKTKKKSPKRARALMYVQQTRHFNGRFTNRQDVENHLMKFFPDAEWAFILHDKDYKVKKLEDGRFTYVFDENGDKIPLEDHIHIALYFPNAKTANSVAVDFGEPAEDKGKTVEYFTGRWGKENMFAYLLHLTQEAKAELKHEYDVSEVTANFDYASYIGRVQNTAEANKLEIDDVKARVISGDLILKDFFRDGKLGNAYTATTFYTDHKHIIDRAIDSRYKLQMSSKGEIDLEVIYIQGPAGSGKTTLAKAYAERKYGDYFISGSSNDTTQDYMGEPVAIFDDARPSDFNASDWLKLLDPYNNKSTVTSRYYNKYLAVDAIILTTTTDFKDFFLYAREKGGVSEPLDQFIRRFNMVIKVDSEIDDDGKQWAVGDLYEVKRVEKYKQNIAGNHVILAHDVIQLPYQIRESIPERVNDEVVNDFTRFFDSVEVDFSEEISKKKEVKRVGPSPQMSSRFA